MVGTRRNGRTCVQTRQVLQEGNAVCVVDFESISHFELSPNNRAVDATSVLPKSTELYAELSRNY